MWICEKADPNALPSITNPILFTASEDLGKLDGTIHCTNISAAGKDVGKVTAALKVLRWIKSLPPIPIP